MVFNASKTSQMCTDGLRGLDNVNLRPEMFDEWIREESIPNWNGILFENLHENLNLIVGHPKF